MRTRDDITEAIEHICAAKLCSVNSMSSRQEMIRLLDEALSHLRSVKTQIEPVAYIYTPIRHDGTTADTPKLVFHPKHMDAMSAEMGAVATPLYTRLPV